MDINENKNSVPEEQFGEIQKESETKDGHSDDDIREKETIPEADSGNETPGQDEQEELPSSNQLKEAEKPGFENVETENSILPDAEDDTESEKSLPVEKVTAEAREENPVDITENEAEESSSNTSESTVEDGVESTAGSVISISDETETESRDNIPDEHEDLPSKTDKKSKKQTDKEILERANEKIRETHNYSLLSRADLLGLLEELLANRPFNEIRSVVEAIKINFYKKFNAELEQKRRSYISEGGSPEDFKPVEEPDELRIRELLKKFRELRLENNRNLEDEKQVNLKKKYKVIEEIKELINRQESINKTFQDFRELQNEWRSIGVVPQPNLNDLWETYHHHVEKFYDYIKINKELKDLDLKKNFEEKLSICEKTEALLLDPNIINAFKILQTYHEEWREIGPVPEDKRTEIWERFKDGTAKINRKHQNYFQDLKDQQKKNLEQKNQICSRVEKILEEDLSSHQDWVKMTNEIIELQRVWKTIGFAPKKDNNLIYSRFRSSCDKFFELKRAYYAQNMESQNENLQKKLDLCVQAEALRESTEWKQTSDELIKFQKQWKEIGPVPRKQSDYIWKRFRVACDKFFSRKSAFLKNIDNSYTKNLELKESLVKEIENFTASDNMDKNLEILQEFQRRWAEIGFVPINKKDMIYQRFRDAINKHYDSLQVDDLHKNVLKYENRLEIIKHKPRSGQKLSFERDKFITKLQQMKNDISVWENNIGFFANTENAEEMKREFEKKIELAKEKAKLLEEKIDMIDKLDLEGEE